MFISVQKDNDPLLDNIRIWWVLLIKFKSINYFFQNLKSTSHKIIFDVDEFLGK